MKQKFIFLILYKSRVVVMKHGLDGDSILSHIVDIKIMLPIKAKRLKLKINNL